MLTLLAALLTAGIPIFLSIVIWPERVWGLFGNPDLGPVDFATLERRSTPNDALVCPPDICTAPSDIPAPVYDVSPQRLRQELDAILASEPRMTVVESDAAALTDRYVQRSRVLGFPDTIVVRFIDRPQGRSTIALYSRSQFGRSDFGVNRKRLERWLEKLAVRVRPLS